MKLTRGYYDVFVRTCAKYPSNIAVRYYHDGIYKTYTYSELYGACEYIFQNLQHLNCNKGVIGLVSERNNIIPCIIAAAHKCCTTFMFINPTQNIENIAKDLNFTIVITIKNSNENDAELFGKKPERTITIFDMTINFYTHDVIKDLNNQYAGQHSFISMTSGSTGEPKHIKVPIQCLQPNIDDLTKMFNITPNDVIYFSTPLTFDPSMVEILLACMNGASLLIAPEKADILFPQNKQNSITFWQTTPSKFLQFSNADIKNIILSANSTLNILALGGEPFNGIRRIKELKGLDNKTKIFTLYGVTEMSCWACITELDLNKITDDREIPLGKCLSETQLVIDNNKEKPHLGKIILVSKTRKCVILNKGKAKEESSSLKFIDTGDIGEVSNGIIYYRGRRDDTIKRFGNKIHLQYIETIIMQCPKVKTCACIWIPKPYLLVVYYSSESLSSQELTDFLKCKLDDKHWPDKIIRVDNLPTNNHGKISRQMLCSMYEKTVGVPQTPDSLKVMLLKELKEVLNKSVTYDQIKTKDFFSLGGTSFQAVSMCNRLSLIFSPFGKLILPYILSQKHTIDEIIQISIKEIFGQEIKVKRRVKRCSSDSEAIRGKMNIVPHKKVTMEPVFDSSEFVVMWNYDTGKCVDASPTLFHTGFNLSVAIGSHSGNVIVVNAMNGELQGTISLGSRIEASVLCCNDSPLGPTYGVVGAYNGTLVCFSLQTIVEIWRINIGAMIKSKGVCCKDQLYIASYDGNVRCIDIKTGAIILTINICEQGISADLVLAKNEYILLGTLSGVCASIHTATNAVTWRGRLNSPVFANLVLYDEDKYVVYAEVNGEIHCRTVEKGIKIWQYQGVKGNIFSSLYIKKIDNIKWQVVFGCHDSQVYSLHIKNFQPSLNWKTQLASPVYATPCGFCEKYILAASNSGRLCIINSENGEILKYYDFPGETFSSPAVYGDYIFIGCRNDYVYALKHLTKTYLPIENDIHI